MLSAGVSRLELFDVWRNEEDSRFDAVLNHISDKSNLKNYDEVQIASICKTLKNFCGQLALKWKKSNRTLKTFLCVQKSWLEGKVIFQGLSIEPALRSITDSATEKIATSSVGRPSKSFTECSQSSKKRKVKHLLNESQEELNFAMQMKLRAEGKRDAANLFKIIADPNTSPKRSTKIKKAIAFTEKLPTKMSVEKALALYVDNKFTKEQYLSIQQTSKAHNANIYPTYGNLLTAKTECYPSDIVITEISGEICLQSLLDHTIKRLVIAQLEVLKSQVEKFHPNLINTIFKWGCDGASSQSRYKQGFEDSENDDSNLFIISIVPLRMSATSKKDNNEIVLWQNPTPSSTKYCRPIKIIFHKETVDFTREEVSKIKSQIEELKPIYFEIEDSLYSIHSRLILTMIDGKICSTLANKSGQNCHICGATPKLMNNLKEVKRIPADEELLALGISSLHAWIKCLECLLHIAYRLDIKTWQIKKENKSQTDKRKKEIQDGLRREMGLLVDIPKQGCGNTNDGNTARRFFSNPEVASNITGINQSLIKRFDTVLRTISCGYAVNVDAFQVYCAETAQLYVDEYKWYYMPQSVHKILIHGSSIIKAAVLPIGQLSEEAQEARNKDSRRFREFHTRKFSRKQTLEDMLHMLLISSDPLISSHRRTRAKLSASLPKEVLALLENPFSNIEGEG